MNKKKIPEIWSKIRCVAFLVLVNLLWMVPCGIKYEQDYMQAKPVLEGQKTEITSLQDVEIPETQHTDTIVCEWLKEEISQEEYELLCRTTYCEAGIESFETQVMVCLTILNRYRSGFGETIHEVVYAKNAYVVTTEKDFESRTWTELTEQAVLQALKENNHPSDMYYFRTKHYHKFGKPYMKSDDLYFSTED